MHTFQRSAGRQAVRSRAGTFEHFAAETSRTLGYFVDNTVRGSKLATGLVEKMDQIGLHLKPARQRT